MEKNIVVFGASNSRESINRRFAIFVANQIENGILNVLDLNDFEMPIYSIDLEKKYGIPEPAKKFKEHLKKADGIIISFAEHNGSYSTAFKNIFDWISRIEKDVWYQKPMFLLSTSPGPGGARIVLQTAVGKFKRMNKNTIVYFSLPSFHENLTELEGVKDPELNAAFRIQLAVFERTLQEAKDTRNF
ncbi:MAG: NAD(P)H-dependent oxidoreductase [Bacteroidota bacterium]